GPVNAADDRLPVKVSDRFKPGNQLPQESFLFVSGLDDAVPFSSLEIQVQPVDPQPVGDRPGPIDVAQNRSTVRRAEVTFAPPPGVQAELADKIGETMIAHH